MYVVARVDRNRYVAMVTDTYEDQGDADIMLLMPKLPAKKFSWPSDMKTATVPLPHILCEVTLSEENEIFSFTKSDLDRLYNLRVLRKQL